VNLSFRAANPADGEQLLIIHRRAILELTGNFYSDEQLASWAHGLTAEGYAGRMQIEQFEVALLQGRIVGFYVIKDRELSGIFVCADHARSGIGSKMMRRALDKLRRKYPVDPLRLTASLAAVDFYQKHGWREVRRCEEKSRGGLLISAVDMVHHLV